MLYNWNLYNIAHQLYFNLKNKTKSTSSWDFPGGPVVMTLWFQCKGVWVQSLVGELRSHMSHGRKKKNFIHWTFFIRMVCCASIMFPSSHFLGLLLVSLASECQYSCKQPFARMTITAVLVRSSLEATKPDLLRAQSSFALDFLTLRRLGLARSFSHSE